MNKGGIQEKVDVSIIIVNYNTSKLINDCIKSVFELTRDISYEIIIVDNATENLKDVIDASDDDRVKCLQLPENVGFGRANNAGAEIAEGRNLFLLNPDTLLCNNAIKILSDYLDNNANTGICGGNLYDETMKPSLSFRRSLPGIGWELNALLCCIPERCKYGNNVVFNTTDIPLPVGYVSGADLMIRRFLFEQIQGFLPDFFMYYEETDLCYRVRRLGHDIMSVPNARIQHLEGKSLGEKFSKRRIEMSENGRQTYLLRNTSRVKRILCDFLHILLCVKSIIIACFKSFSRVRNAYEKFKITLNVVLNNKPL